MITMRRSLGLAPIAVLVALVGCSSSVEVIDANGSNQSASQAGDLCDQLCEIPSCAAAVDDCHAECMALYRPNCTAETEAMLECAIDVVTTKCELEGDMCAAERAPYDACPH